VNIDWFTVSAQIVNFLILVWLLNRFLYQPVLNAIDAREQRIANELQEAVAIKADADQQRQRYHRKQAELEQQRAELTADAVQQAEAERQRLIDAARNEIAQSSEQWRAALAAQQQSLQQQLTRRIQQEVFAIARKTLADLATVDLQQQMINVFIQRLQQQSNELAVPLSALASGKPGKILIRSPFELNKEQRLSIRETLEKVAQQSLDIYFESRADLLCGLELMVDGFKIAWSIDDYLDRMESGLNELYQQHPAGETESINNANAPV